MGVSLDRVLAASRGMEEKLFMVFRFVLHRNLTGDERFFLVAISIEKCVAFLRDGFQVFIDRVHAAGGVHPAGAGIEALVNEKLAPGDGAVSVQPFLAHHLQLGAEEERGVRIDQQ